MLEEKKPFESLTVADFLANPVWEFVNEDEVDETLVRPVREIPVNELVGKLIGAQVRLASGDLVWAILGNIDTKNPKSTEHFLSASFERDGKWFFLSRYHDLDYADQGAEALSYFLGMKIDDVFPISFDIQRYVVGDKAALSGNIPKEPRERLTREELIAMAIS